MVVFIKLLGSRFSTNWWYFITKFLQKCYNWKLEEIRNAINMQIFRIRPKLLFITQLWTHEILLHQPCGNTKWPHFIITSTKMHFLTPTHKASSSKLILFTNPSWFTIFSAKFVINAVAFYKQVSKKPLLYGIRFAFTIFTIRPLVAWFELAARPWCIWKRSQLKPLFAFAGFLISMSSLF